MRRSSRKVCFTKDDLNDIELMGMSVGSHTEATVVRVVEVAQGSSAESKGVIMGDQVTKFDKCDNILQAFERIKGSNKHHVSTSVTVVHLTANKADEVPAIMREISKEKRARANTKGSSSTKPTNELSGPKVPPSAPLQQAERHGDKPKLQQKAAPTKKATPIAPARVIKVEESI